MHRCISQLILPLRQINEILKFEKSSFSVLFRRHFGVAAIINRSSSPSRIISKMFYSTMMILALLATAATVRSGLVAQGLCYTACNVGYGACLSFVGVTAGVAAPATAGTIAAGVPAACVACSAAQGMCMAACTPLLLAPTP